MDRLILFGISVSSFDGTDKARLTVGSLAVPSASAIASRVMPDPTNVGDLHIFVQFATGEGHQIPQRMQLFTQITHIIYTILIIIFNVFGVFGGV